MMYEVKCGGRERRVYETAQGSCCCVIYAPGETVEIIYGGKVDSAQISPKSRGIKARTEENRIFIPAAEDKLAVIVNGDIQNPLYLFMHDSGALIPTPDKNDGSVIFYGGGGTHKAGEIHLESGQTLWIDEDTAVDGCIIADGAENIKIQGYGILNGSGYMNGTRILNCRNVEIEGITLIKESTEWANRIFCSENVHIRDYKVISRGRYSDGLDLLGSKNVLAEGLFIRSEDDSIVLKTDKFGYKGSVRNITVRSSTIWNGHGGNALEIGYELNGGEVCGVLFENIDIIRTDEPTCYFRCGALTIHNAGDGRVHDITYRDIRVESAKQELVYIGTVDNIGEWGAGGGTIENILIDRLSLTGGAAVTSFAGSDDENRVSGIVFRNCSYHGRKIKSAADFKLKTKNTEVVFEEGE